MGDRKVMAATRNEPNPADMTPERWQQMKGLLAVGEDVDAGLLMVRTGPAPEPGSVAPAGRGPGQCQQIS